MSTTGNEREASVTIETDEAGWGSLTDFVDRLRDAEIPGVSVETQKLSEPRKSLGDVAVWASVVASSIRLAGPTLVALLGELLHRPGKTTINVTVTDPDGNTRHVVVDGSHLKPSDFATTIQSLEVVLGTSKRVK